ncbi:hypothetical protein PC113_g12950 [Phytophthora cactorum]|uniref:Uncharacterized protein n=1 Tax=Phytophthora cactorum TaxID=29920 RepID=A0A8T0YYL5_9STRA|nr:hypothetical protein PC113_g12950 [Phytophthora cactorum]
MIILSLKCEKLNIWLESQSSKKQCNLDSCKDEYVTTANTFVDASAADYASYFQQYLDCPPDKTQESHHKLFIRRPGEGVDGVRIAPNSEILLRYFAEGCESEHLLEERSRKKQWQTGYLNKKNYVTAANSFVDASAAEYIWQCLDCPLGKEEDAERKLTLQKGGKLQLELSLKIRLLHSARIICYAFKLQPDSVERMDILESKLKDQQEELQKLRSKVDASNVFLCAECEVLMETKLQWKEINSETFVLDDDNTSIVALVLGLYVLGVVLNLPPAEDGYCTGDEWCRDSNSSYMLRQLLR